MDADPLIGVDALAARLNAPDLRVLDASWGPPGAATDHRAAFAAERIPGAAFFDLEDLSDRDHALPMMAPPTEKFISRMRRAGIGDGASIVVYDTLGVFSAARAWWLFRLMGHEDVRVLDGGLRAWRAAGLPLEDGPPSPRPERHFTARRRADLTRGYEEVRRALETGAAQVVDARPAARFEGREPEPRPGLALGHMPGAINAPYSDLIGPDGRMKDAAALEAYFAARGIEPRRPLIASCGSGVSAAVTLLALARLGATSAALYDGSWADWGARADAPVATGA